MINYKEEKVIQKIQSAKEVCVFLSLQKKVLKNKFKGMLVYNSRFSLNPNVFKNNFPGPDWLQGFIKCHCLMKYITDNVKASRAVVNEDVINDYFNHLKDVPASHFFNYDETDASDDPRLKQVITLRGRNRVECEVHHSK